MVFSQGLPFGTMPSSEGSFLWDKKYEKVTGRPRWNDRLMASLLFILHYFTSSYNVGSNPVISTHRKKAVNSVRNVGVDVTEPTNQAMCLLAHLSRTQLAVKLG